MADIELSCKENLHPILKNEIQILREQYEFLLNQNL